MTTPADVHGALFSELLAYVRPGHRDISETFRLVRGPAVEAHGDAVRAVPKVSAARYGFRWG
ncbi:hypothetical protein GCM10017557_29940 [Streptomyces aurantiacus]|uniref:Uncharacterized protein n=1 Tax=Streptomyces aurantiacus TaxID=47760 RepID=A0A7G1P4Z9_9ACTN|nr:hypothetical protein GCM10017557_29940 [Streptomyces aurantiacus]